MGQCFSGQNNKNQIDKSKSRSRNIKSEPGQNFSSSRTIFSKLTDYPDLTRKTISFLDINDQIHCNQLNKKANGILNEQTKLYELLRLILTYKIFSVNHTIILSKLFYDKHPDRDSVTFYDPPAEMLQSPEALSHFVNQAGRHEVKNPIIKLIYLMLKKNPGFLLRKSDVVGNYNQTYKNISPLDYLCWSGNFIVLDLIAQLIEGADEIIANKLEQMDELTRDFDIEIMPTLTIDQDVDDLFRLNTFVLLPRGYNLPQNIPYDALLLELHDSEIRIYKMVGQDLILDKSVNLQELNVANTLSLDSSDKPEQLQNNPSDITNLFARIDIPREINIQNNVDLFNTLRVICGYTKALVQRPTLIKRMTNDDNPLIYMWGNLNSKWQLTDMPTSEVKRFERTNLFPASESKFSKSLLSVNSIKAEIYTLFTHAHTVKQFGLTEYVQKSRCFSDKYPVMLNMPDNRFREEEILHDWCTLLGQPQQRFPSWIGQMWCANVNFTHRINHIDAILATDISRLVTYFGDDFYNNRLGVNRANSKIGNNCLTAGKPALPFWTHSERAKYSANAMHYLNDDILDHMSRLKKIADRPPLDRIAGFRRV